MSRMGTIPLPGSLCCRVGVLGEGLAPRARDQCLDALGPFREGEPGTAPLEHGARCLLGDNGRVHELSRHGVLVGLLVRLSLAPAGRVGGALAKVPGTRQGGRKGDEERVALKVAVHLLGLCLQRSLFELGSNNRVNL